jgi:hypothetical protein
MGTQLEERSIRLATGRTLRLRGAAGWAVTCCAGTVWITQEGDPRDIFLQAGESFTLDRTGLALVHALKGFEDIWRGNTGMTVVNLWETARGLKDASLVGAREARGHTPPNSVGIAPDS